ncbi:MAG: BrnA antitoxin family protein [Candidatus Cloacimonadales bacterium]|nr:BrnA antitoxin family protein [Candidatus Cloacimonadales bacterium]
MNKDKKIPKFKNEDEERKFWKEADSSQYINWKNADRVTFPKLKPSTKTISLRLPKHMLDEIKMIANKRDVPYQSLIKFILKDRIDDELKHSAK